MGQGGVAGGVGGARGRRMRSRASGGPVRNWAGDGTAMAQWGLRRAVAGSGALRGATPLTCADSVRRRSRTAVFAPGKGLLMRFGFAPIRGSNPRASALRTGSLCHRRGLPGSGSGQAARLRSRACALGQGPAFLVLRLADRDGELGAVAPGAWVSKALP